MEPIRESVSVIGGGSWGTAIAQLAADAGADVLMWMRDAAKAEAINATRRNETYWPQFELGENIRATSDLEELAGHAKLIFSAAPSHGFRDIARELGSFIGGDHILIHGTKGLEPDTQKRMSEIIKEETPAKRIGVLCGPNIAEETMQRQPAATVVASKYPEVVERAQAALASPSFRVYGSRDPLGVEYAGALKNVVAICAGIVSGLGMGSNTLAMLITRGAAEMRRFGIRMGAMDVTFSGLAGIGDLIVTCSSSLSRNHRVGVRLSGGEKLDDIISDMKRVAEGVKAAKSIYEIARRNKIDMPIVWGVYAMLYEGAGVDEVKHILMTRPSIYEEDYSRTDR